MSHYFRDLRPPSFLMWGLFCLRTVSSTLSLANSLKKGIFRILYKIQIWGNWALNGLFKPEGTRGFASVWDCWLLELMSAYFLTLSPSHPLWCRISSLVFSWPTLASKSQTSDPPNHFWYTMNQLHLFGLWFAYFSFSFGISCLSCAML